MKRHWYYAILFAVVLLFTCACTTKEEEDEPIEVFSYQNGSMTVELGDIFTREKYGKEIAYSEIPSCAFEGLDKTYTYEHYEITTYPAKDGERISSIYFLDESIKTQENISLGDTKEDMINAYGKNYQQENNVYTYTKGKTKLEFLLQNDVIISIEYLYQIEDNN